MTRSEFEKKYCYKKATKLQEKTGKDCLSCSNSYSWLTGPEEETEVLRCKKMNDNAVKEKDNFVDDDFVCDLYW